MNLDESMAYALATWARFDEAITDDLLRAVCGSFVIVTAADRDVAETEITGSLDVVRERSKAFALLDARAPCVVYELPAIFPCSFRTHWTKRISSVISSGLRNFL